MLKRGCNRISEQVLYLDSRLAWADKRVTGRQYSVHKQGAMTNGCSSILDRARGRGRNVSVHSTSSPLLRPIHLSSVGIALRLGRIKILSTLLYMCDYPPAARLLPLNCVALRETASPSLLCAYRIFTYIPEQQYVFILPVNALKPSGYDTYHLQHKTSHSAHEVY